MSKFWSWIKKNYKWIVGTFIVVAMVMCLYWFRHDLKELEIVKRKIDIAKKKRDISVLEEQKKILSNQKNATKEEIKVIDDRIEESYKEINKKRAEISKLNLNETLDELDKMGY